MGIRTWRKIGHALLAAGLGLLVAGAVFMTHWCIWAGTVVLFVALVVDIAFLKCPKCGKRLPLFRYEKDCPECGESLRNFY